MELHIKTVDHIHVVEIRGEIDGKTAPEIQQTLQAELDDLAHIVFDMSQVEYMSSAGLRMLLSMYRQVKEQQGHIVLTGLSEDIREIMSITGFLNHFTIRETLEDGMKE